MGSSAKTVLPSARIVLLGGGIVFVYLALAVPQIGWVAAWSPLGVGGLTPIFRDLFGLVEAANCARAGIDSYTTLCGINDSYLNYPPIWLHLLQFSLADVPLLGTLIDIGVVLVFARLVRGRTATWGYSSLAALFSPSIMLGLERCNGDMIVFILVGIAAMVFSQSKWSRAGIAFLLMAAGIILKLYPVFGLSLAARFERRSAIFALGLVVLTLIYALAIAGYITLIGRNMQLSPVASYGYLVPFMVIDGLRGISDISTAIGVTSLPQICATLTVILIIAAVIIARSKRIRIRVASQGESGTAFLLGAGIFCGTFLLQSNWSYRLIFLLLCLPQLFDWWDESEKNASIKGLLLGVMLLLWTSNNATPLMAALLAQWVLFAIFGFLLLSNFLETVFAHKQTGTTLR